MLMLELPTENVELKERFQRLNLPRRMIVMTYFEIKKNDQGSLHRFIPKIAAQLRYSIDVNGSNSYLQRVIQEFLGVR